MSVLQTHSVPWENHGRLRASSDGHFLEHADGTAFCWLGDTAWSLHQNLSREDVLLYLDDAVTSGFTVIQLMTVNAWALNDWRNYYGHTPYLGDVPAHLNPPFWEHLGWVIDQAAARGLYVMLVFGSPGRLDDHGAVAHTPQQAYDYGNALGAQFAAKPNLIWSNGIDVNPDDAKGVSTERSVSGMGMEGWHAMAEGVFDGICGSRRFDGTADWSRALMTYHPAGNHSPSEWFHDAPWLHFNGPQVGLVSDGLITTISRDYARVPNKPVINTEPWYEACAWRKKPVDDWECRMQAYQSLMAGACGHTYGHWNLYAFDSRHPQGGKWQSCLHAPGRRQMIHCRTLLEAMLPHRWIPASGFVTPDTTADAYSLEVPRRISAALSRSGRRAWVYTPAGAGFTVDLSRMGAGQIQTRWFDPRTGNVEIAHPSGQTPARFEPPGMAAEANDWVLMLESTE